MPYGKRSSRQRPHDAASSSRVPSVEREQPGPCRPLRPEREDGAQMAQADHNRRRAHGSEEAEEHGADAGRGGHRGGVPAEDAAATGRCPGLLARRDPSPQSQRLAQMPATPRRLPVADRGDPRAAQTVQDLRERFKTYEIGYVHIDSCELRHADGKLVMFLAIDRVSKLPTSSSTTARASWRARPFSATPCRSSPIRSTPCSPTMAWPLPTCPRTGTAPAAACWDPTSST